MEVNRNQWFLIGLVLLLLGTEFRLVDSFVLTPEFTQFLAERARRPIAAVSAATQSLLQTERPLLKRTVRPPEFLGWALLSLGAVLVLQSMAMKKPA